MAMFTRRPKLPAEYAAIIAAADVEERVVAWGTVPDNGVIVATPRGLWWPSDAGSLRRIGWERISKAVWREGALVVIEADVVDDLVLIDREPVALPMDDPGEIPATVRRRIEASVVRSEIVPVVGGQVRIVARRVPGRDGLTWWMRPEGSTPDNAVVRDQAEAAIARLRADEAARTPN